MWLIVRTKLGLWYALILFPAFNSFSWQRLRPHCGSHTPKLAMKLKSWIGKPPFRILLVCWKYLEVKWSSNAKWALWMRLSCINIERLWEPNLGISIPAASQACMTVLPLGIWIGCSLTNTSIMSGCGTACCEAAVLLWIARPSFASPSVLTSSTSCAKVASFTSWQFDSKHTGSMQEVV